MHSYSISKSPSLKKSAHNKYLIIPIIFILIAATFFSSINTVKANPLALSGGITVGAGVYVTAALLVAGGAGLVGYDEYSEEINAHAKTVWDGSTQLSKDSLQWTVNQAVGAGNGLINIGQNYLDWSEGQIQNVAGAIAGLVANGGKVYPAGENLSVSFTGAGFSISLSQKALDEDLMIWINGGGYTSTSADLYGSNLFVGNVIKSLDDSQIKLVREIISRPPTIGSFTTLASMAGIGGFTVAKSDTFSPVYNQAVSKTREAWESMRDAGLVIPVDSAIPHANGKQATYDPQTDTYTGIDGGVLNPSDVTWSFPVPKYRDKNVPVPGVYVDTPPLTGVPSIDEAIVKNPAIPKTTTNVNTGVTILNPDIPNTANPPIEGEIPGGEVPPTTPTTPKLPGSQPIIPIAILLALFDLLRAILMYLSRMFAFLVTIPFVVSIPIDNPYFQWFRTATILGVQPYPLVMSTAAFFMSFAAYKSIRRLLP